MPRNFLMHGDTSFSILQLNKEGLLNKEAELKSNGVSIDIIPTVIVETTEEKPMGRKGSLRFRGTVSRNLTSILKNNNLTSLHVYGL